MIKKILHNSIFGVVSQVIGGGIFFLISIFIARHLGPEKFGTFTFIIALTIVFYMLADFGISSILAREIAKNKEKTPEIIGSAVPLVIFLGLVSYGAIFITAQILQLPKESETALYVMGSSILFTYLAAVFGAVCRGFEDMLYNAAGLITQRIVLLGCVSLAVYMGAGIVEFVLCYLVESIYECLFFFFIVRKRYPRYSLQLNFKFWKQLLSESAPLGFAILFKRVSWHVDTFVLTMISTASAVGVFSAAYRIVQMISVIPFTLSIPLYPVISRLAVNSKSDAFLVYKKALHFFMLLAIPLGVWVNILGAKLIILLFGDQYEQAGLVLQTMSWIIMLIFPNILYMYVFPAINKQKLFMFCMSIGFTVNLAMDFILIPDYGFMGAALATLLSELTIYLLGLLLLMTQGLRVDYFRLILRPLLVTMVAAIALISPFLNDSLLTFISASLLYFLLVITMYFLTRLIKVSELKMILNKTPQSAN